MDILGQSALLVVITSLSLGLSVLSRNIKNKLFLTYALLCLLISCWAFSFFMSKFLAWNGFYRFHLFCNVWLAPAGLMLVQVMIRIRNVFSLVLFRGSLVFAIALSLLLIFGWDTTPFLRDVVYLSPVLIVIQILQLIWIDIGIMKGERGFPPKKPIVGMKSGRRFIIYIGGLVVLATSLMDHFPFLGQAVPSIGNVGLTIYLFFISQGISQQRLLNFGALVSKFLVLLGVALILTAVYILLFAWIKTSLPLFFLNSFLMSFLLLMLLDPLRSLVRYFTHQLLTKEHLRLEQILREAQRRLTGIVDLDPLFQSILETITNTIAPERAFLFVLRADGTKYYRVRVIGKGLKQQTREILVDHPLLHYCKELRRKSELPVLLEQYIENEIDRSASRTQREHLAAIMEGLKALDSNLLIPLFESDRILAFVALYVPGPPEPWGNNWGLLHIIYPYFEQAAQAMRNMEVYVQQKQKERLATLGEMAAGLAHEIRNPLGAIKGAAQFLDPSADRPESQFLRVIIEEVDRLNHVVTQFLDYSKPHSVDFELVDVAKIARKTIALLKSGLKPDIEIEFKPAMSGAFVQGAPGQIQQLLMNLIQNSIQVLEGHADGKIIVTVSIEGEEWTRDVIVSVEDNGPGIKKEHIDKLFIPFFTTSSSGTGLGLSICQKIVEAHKGRIEVSAEDGQFTRFSVYIPLATIKGTGISERSLSQ